MPASSQHQLLPMKMAAALRRLSPSFLERQSRWLLAAQGPSGGWAGRGGGADLYYTSFAVRSADLLDIRQEEAWSGVLAFLGQDAPVPQDVVDCCAFAEAWAIARSRSSGSVPDLPPGKRPDDIAAALERARDGDAYCSAAGAPGSVYLAYLAGRTYQALGRQMPGLVQAAQWVAARQGDGGGFAESDAAGGVGTNPTAAGFCFLVGSIPLCSCVGQEAARFLASMQRPVGGFAAHAEAPEPDLLSTFTALYALAAADSSRSADLSGAARFVKSLAGGDGGFRGSPSDGEADVEYQFYGLGSLGLLALAAAQSAPQPSSSAP